MHTLPLNIYRIAVLRAYETVHNREVTGMHPSHGIENGRLLGDRGLKLTYRPVGIIIPFIAGPFTPSAPYTGGCVYEHSVAVLTHRLLFLKPKLPVFFVCSI